MKAISPTEKLLAYLANEGSQGSLYGAMIGRPLAIEILSRELHVEEDLKRIRSSGHQGVLEKAIKEAVAAKQVNVDSISQFVNKEIAEIHKKPEKEYRVVIPLTFNFFTIVAWQQHDMRIIIRGKEVILGSLGTWIPAPALERLRPQATKKDDEWLGPLMAAFCTKCRGRDAYYALTEALGPTGLAASMLVHCLSTGTNIRFPPMPIESLKLQDCAVVLEGDTNLTYETFGLLELSQEAPLGLTLNFDGLWTNVKILERMLQAVEDKTPEPLKSAIYKSIELYHEAANEMDPNFAVLKIWIALERLMGLGRNINEKEAASRLKTAFRKKPEIWDIEVDRLKNSRNNLVHNGLFDATFQDVYFAKILYEFTLGLALKYGTEYKNDDAWETLFELGGSDADSLAEVKKALDFLIST